MSKEQYVHFKIQVNMNIIIESRRLEGSYESG